MTPHTAYLEGYHAARDRKPRDRTNKHWLAGYDAGLTFFFFGPDAEAF